MENFPMTDDQLVLKWRLQTLLRENVVEVVFTKVNGDQRRMKCTLKSDLLPEMPNEPGHPGPENVLPVWDIEKNGWRSFRIENVLDFMPVRGE